jgi:hypothetical protein
MKILRFRNHSFCALTAFAVLSTAVVHRARADLTLDPLSSWSITGNLGDVMALNGIPTNSMILGMTLYSTGTVNPSAPNNFSYFADDFSLATSAIADNTTYVSNYFGQAVTSVFLLEKSGNDSGSFQGLGPSGEDVGNPISFSSHTSGGTYWTDTGFTADSLNPQNAWGLVINSDTPIYGIRMTNPSGTLGIDPISIMAVPVPEPVSSVLLALCALGAVRLLRRKR